MELASLILGRKGSSCVLRLVKCNGGGEEYVTLERFESSSEEMRDSSKGKKTGSGSQSASRTPTDSTLHQQPASRAKTSGGGGGAKGRGKHEGGTTTAKSPRGGGGGMAIPAAKNISVMGIVEPSSSRESWQSDVTGLWGREMARER